jgi:hypothetical protein
LGYGVWISVVEDVVGAEVLEEREVMRRRGRDDGVAGLLAAADG